MAVREVKCIVNEYTGILYISLLWLLYFEMYKEVIKYKAKQY